MDSIVDTLRTNYVPFWLHWSTLAAVGLGWFSYLGVVLLLRVLLEGKLYFGPYLAFPVGGFCLGVLFGLAKLVLNGATPQAFYTELWFYALLGIATYIGVVLFKWGEAKTHEQKNHRPADIRKQPSERGHTYWALPFLMVWVVWFVFLAGDVVLFWDDKSLVEIITGLIVGAFMIVGVAVLDKDRPFPQSLEEWMVFWPQRIVVLIISVGASFASLLLVG